MTLVASFAKGTPIVLLTKGTVREALGFTSRTYTSPFFTANWIFISPTTLSSLARRIVSLLISSRVSLLREYGGREQALSPECTPASSICSIIPPITTFLPSEMASTSISIASSKYLSMSTGCLGETLTAYAI